MKDRKIKKREDQNRRVDDIHSNPIHATGCETIERARVQNPVRCVNLLCKTCVKIMYINVNTIKNHLDSGFTIRMLLYLDFSANSTKKRNSR
jgi:hypothetical protein